MPSYQWLTAFTWTPKGRSRSQSLTLPHKRSRKSFGAHGKQGQSFAKIGRRCLYVVTLGVYPGRPRLHSDAGPVRVDARLSGTTVTEGRARSMSLPESATATLVEGGHYPARNDCWVSRLETIDDCTENSKKSRGSSSRQSFDCRAVAGKRIRSHSWFTRLDEQVAAEFSDRDSPDETIAPASPDREYFEALAPRNYSPPVAVRGYAPSQQIESYDDAYDFEDYEVSNEGECEDAHSHRLSALRCH